MRISRKKKNKVNQSLKNTLQEWLAKIINPEQSGQKASVQVNTKTHIHYLEGITARAKGHKEQFFLKTGKPIITPDSHIHEYSGIIMADTKTAHRIKGSTGSAILQGADHYHMVTGSTSMDDQHVHKYTAQTFPMFHQAKRLKRSISKRYDTSITPAGEESDTLPVEQE